MTTIGKAQIPERPCISSAGAAGAKPVAHSPPDFVTLLVLTAAQGENISPVLRGRHPRHRWRERMKFVQSIAAQPP